MTERLSIDIVPLESNVETRVEAITQDADLSWVVDLLTAHRDEILGRWLDAAGDQPFHRARAERAVADHIPALYDALVRLLTRHREPSGNAGAPLEDPDLLSAAQSHASMRLEQGFSAPDVATEFRLLRQEIGRALRQHVPERAPSGDVGGAELLLHDALDGAVFLALTALSEHEGARRKAELALLQERASSSSEREAFFATLGHDLKSPVASAIAMAQLLHHQAKKGPIDPEQLVVRLSSIEAALRRGALRVDELMDLARRDSTDAWTLRTQPVDLVPLVKGVVEGYRQTNDSHEFVVSGPEALVTACDHDRIERSVDNLVSNAVKFSPRGGIISVAVTEEGASDHRVAVIAITDHGLGVPEDERDLVFERYRRGSNVSDIHGSGVGLWSVREIVVRHGGSLVVDSRIGEGSTFTIRLPLVQEMRG